MKNSVELENGNAIYNAALYLYIYVTHIYCRMDVDPLYCDNATERLAWVENKMWSRLSKYVRKYLKSFMSTKITMERIVKCMKLN